MASSSQGRNRKKADKPKEAEQSQLVLDDHVNKCVRYILCRSSSDVPILKSEIVKHAIPGMNAQFETIMESVSNTLDTVYGVRLTSFKSGLSKCYVALAKHPQPEGIDSNRTDDANKVLTMFILTHLFMSNDLVTEASLIAFLEGLNIDFDGNHKLFGNVKQFVNSTMVKQKYIKINVDDVTKRGVYSWGDRAQATISKRKILEFVAKIYDKDPVAFKEQNKVAASQQLV